ncbi:MAG: plastocyanin/azurin family copper-binding protein [Candidatus Poseidoniaceae archaeon]
MFHTIAAVTLLLLTVLAPIPPVGAQASEDALAECAVVVSIGSGGMSFDDRTVEIEAGQTVCWRWDNETMAHNVAQTTSTSETTRMEGGVYSGAPNTTVDFRYTFTENQTFTYICEPHASVMKGTVIVGGSDEASRRSSPTPGFSSLSLIICFAAAAFALGNRDGSIPQRTAVAEPALASSVS